MTKRFPDVSEIEEISDFLINRWWGLYGFTVTLRGGSIKNYYVYSIEDNESVETLREAYNSLCRQLGHKKETDNSTPHNVEKTNVQL